MNVPVPNVYSSPPDQALISAYEKLLFENADDKVVLGREIIASDLSCLTSNGWLALSIVKEFLEVFNKQSSETLVLVLNDLIALGKKSSILTSIRPNTVGNVSNIRGYSEVFVQTISGILVIFCAEYVRMNYTRCSEAEYCWNTIVC